MLDVGTRMIRRVGQRKGRGFEIEILGAATVERDDGGVETLYFWRENAHDPPSWATEKWLRENYWILVE